MVIVSCDQIISKLFLGRKSFMLHNNHVNWYKIFTSIAFRFDPEFIHEITSAFLHELPILGSWHLQKYQFDSRLHAKYLDLNHPLMIAAGLDKNARMLEYFQRLNIGAIEVGTVTLKPQIGNPRPRIWRIKEERSLRNAMGFPNDGQKEILKRLQKFRRNHPESAMKIGVNIGKNKETLNAESPQEYAKLYEIFCEVSDYIVINISSPNTPNLRDLQSVDGLKAILDEVEKKMSEDDPPLYIKLSPDMAQDQYLEVFELIQNSIAKGIILTNTTSDHSYDKGGLSGEKLKEKAKAVYTKFLEMNRQSQKLDIICVGGLSCYDDIVEIWKHGGSKFQVYTSFIYQGPYLINYLNQAIQEDLASKNLSNLIELIDFYQPKK
jgi:dihydroorotate dehydrogenase